jgi:hypothetical protein
MGARKQATTDTASIQAAITILMWGKFSPFEYEGPAIAGFRSALCLSGLPWRAADRRAVIIVSEALRRIGARRPSWNEAQPEWTEPGFSPYEYLYCQNCGRQMELSTALNGVTRKWCSDLCRKAVSVRRWRENDGRQTRAAWLAASAVRRSERRADRARPCLTCGQMFIPSARRENHAQGEQRYCSHTCAKRFRQPRTCRQCGDVFQGHIIAVHCSPRCRADALNEARRHRREKARQKAEKLAPELAPGG